MRKLKSFGIISFLCALMLCIGLFSACSSDPLVYEDKGENGYTVKAANTDISGDIVIPAEHDGKPVYALEVRAFKDCAKVTSITIPESMTSIAAEAFGGCQNCEVIIPVSITDIGADAFHKVTVNDLGNGGGTSTVSDNIGFSITYKGTKEQWRKINSKTHYTYSSIIVTCSDGKILLKNGKDVAS